MAAFCAERKLLFEVNCFRFCPPPDLPSAVSEGRYYGYGPIRGT